MNRIEYSRGVVGPMKEPLVRTIEDEWYDNLKIDIITGKWAGLFIFTRGKDGTYRTKFQSRSMAYFIIIYTAMCYLWYYTLDDLLDLIRVRRVPGAYILFIFLFVQPMPFIFIAESKKLNKYFNTWLAFEKKFLSVTGRKFNVHNQNYKIMVIVMKIALFVFLIVLLKNQFRATAFLSKFLIIYYYWVISIVTSLWYQVIYFLYKTAKTMQNLAMVVRNRAGKVTFAEVESLWLDMYKLGKLTGQTFCFTYCYFILFLFLTLTVTTYETLNILDLPITIEKIFSIFFAVAVMIHTASIPYTSQMAVKAMGDDFYKILLDLKMKENHPAKRGQEIDGLLQVISDNRPLIDLGGFVTLDNGLITSLMSTMVTYLIVLVQFKV